MNMHRSRGRDIRSFSSEAGRERELGHSIKKMRDDIHSGSQLVSLDDINTLFSKGMKDGAVDAYNYATFFVCLREACFNPQISDFEQIDLNRAYDTLNSFLHYLPEFVDRCDGKQACMILFALAKMSYDRDVEAIYSLLDQTAEKVRRLDIRAIANVLWAAAVLRQTGHPAVATFAEAARHYIEYLDMDDPKDCLVIDQLYRFHFVSHTLPEVENLFLRLPLFDQNDQKVSVAQRYLYNAVCKALPPQATVTLSKFIKEIRCDLDIAIECGDLRFDIECDGPHHVFRRLADELNDGMRTEKGWEVFRIATRSDMLNHELNDKIKPVISEIRGKLADVIPDLLAQDIEPIHQTDIADSSDLSDQIRQARISNRYKKFRVYAIARHLGIDNKELVDRMREYGIDAAHHMSKVTQRDAERIIMQFYPDRKTVLEQLDIIWRQIYNPGS